ncbi:MAG: hypothetical protein ACYDC5_07180 [Candidatus Dormibacteria bacterium]
MLALTSLPLLALLFPGLGALAAGVVSRPLVRDPGAWARWAVRGGLLLALAAASYLLFRIQPSGTVGVTLWQFYPTLPVTLQAEVGGTTISILVLTAALVVSFSAADRRPLASAALGLAAMGGVLAALSGGLLSLFIGLQLSAVGGIGLSYARFPRAASHRIVWAAVADQSVALIWLGAVVAVYHSAGTLQFNDIPTGAMNFSLAVVLLVPAVVRLSTVVLLGRGGTAGQGLRDADLADWLTVAAVPTALVLLLRVQELSGGSWPSAGFGTVVDLLALLAALSAAWRLLRSPAGAADVGALLLVAVALTLLGFGSNSPTGTELGVGAGLFLQVAAAFLPRAALSGQPAAEPGGWIARSLTWLLRIGIWAAFFPFSLALVVAVTGLALALGSGGWQGLMPTLGYGSCVVTLGLTFRAVGRLPPIGAGVRWALAVPAVILIGSATLSGWAVNGLAGTISFSGAQITGPLSSPDPLSLAMPGLLLPAGYLALLTALLGIGWMALRYAFGPQPLEATGEVGERPVHSEELVPGGGGPLDSRRVLAFVKAVREVAAMGLAISERELAERPVWLWFATTATVAWLMAQR